MRQWTVIRNDSGFRVCNWDGKIAKTVLSWHQMLRSRKKHLSTQDQSRVAWVSASLNVHIFLFLYFWWRKHLYRISYFGRQNDKCRHRWGAIPRSWFVFFPSAVVEVSKMRHGIEQPKAAIWSVTRWWPLDKSWLHCAICNAIESGIQLYFAPFGVRPLFKSRPDARCKLYSRRYYSR